MGKMQTSDLLTLRVMREITLETLDRLQDGSYYGPSLVLGYSEEIHRINLLQYNQKLEAIDKRIAEITSTDMQGATSTKGAKS